jgi:hypothetical protein
MNNGTAQVLPPYDTIYYFDQLIDHHNPSLGTFKQRYEHIITWQLDVRLTPPRYYFTYEVL